MKYDADKSNTFDLEELNNIFDKEIRGAELTLECDLFPDSTG